MPALQDTNPPNLWAWFNINDVQVTGYSYKTKWKCEQAQAGINKSPINGRVTIKGDDHAVEYKAYYGDDLELTTNGAGIILTSPNGTRYLITVQDDGTLVSSGAQIAHGGSGGSIPPPPPGA